VFPSGSAALEIVVLSVSRQSARCEVAGTAAPVEIGALAEVLVPASRAAAVQEHPPWTHPPESWDADVPLLAPAKARTPADRERDFSGRVYQSADSWWDSEGDSQSYLWARTGLELEVDNASGRGDVLRFDGEVFLRDFDDGNGSEDDFAHGRIERFSWRLGDSREDPDRVEIGRFLHSEMPQLGIVDGVEYVRRTASGSRFGASVGLYPEWDAELTTGDDVQASLFYRLYAGDDGQLSAGAALQSTWHEGESDRQRAVGDVSWRANERFWLAGSATVDFYGSDDEPKSSGAELTEAHASATWRPSAKWGMSASLTHVRWPVTLHDELPPVTLETLDDGVVDRAGVNVWTDLSRSVRVHARADAWENDDDDGVGGEARVSLRDLVWEHGQVGLAAFANEGEIVSLQGLRVDATRSTELGFWTLGYELAELEQDVFAAGLDASTRHTVRGAWDSSFGEGWTLSVSGDVLFGDDDDGQRLGFRVQRRF
jgi:hypothetical protein